MERGLEARKECPYCEGKGYASVRGMTNGAWLNELTWATSVREECPLCSGTGHLPGYLPTSAERNDAQTGQVDMMSDHLDALVNELRAIDYWDDRYEPDREPEWGETVAYTSRQRRRGEIIREILRFVPIQPGTE